MKHTVPAAPAILVALAAVAVLAMTLASPVASAAPGDKPAVAPATPPAAPPADKPAAPPPSARVPTADELLTALDANMTFATRTAKLKMTVVNGKRTRVFEIISYGRGEEDAAMEYRAPAREKGTRMLKLGDELWIYMPTIDRVQKISGHMLRQGMMGSDLSYEDMMASRELRKRYTSKVTGDATVGGRPCWKLEMVATDKSVTYPRRETCVDKETMIAVEQKLFALSGMLIKTWTMSAVQTFEGGRRFPTKMVIRDHLRKGSETRIEMSGIRFGVALEREVFSLRWLERR